MSTNFYLSVGDGATSDYLSLNSGDYGVLLGGFIAPPPGPRDRTREVMLYLSIKGSDMDTLLANVRAIETKLNQASSGRRPSGVTAGVTLGVQLDGASEMVYLDVLSGTLQYDAAALRLAVIRKRILPATLALTCLPYGRGDAITDSPVTVTGDAPTWTRASIPGDCPALVQYTITDGSGNSQFLNRIRIGHRSLVDLDAGDFDGYYDAVAISPATDAADATAFGDEIATLDSADVVVTTWQDVAFVTTPTAYADNAGLFDIWARVDDANGAIGAPTLNQVAFTTGGSLTVGQTYQLCVTAIDGSSRESLPSAIFSRTIPNTTNDALIFQYTAPFVGTAASYRCYLKPGAGPWRYFTDAAPNFTLTTESGATLADPPSSESAVHAQFRAQVSHESGTTKQTLPPVLAVLSNGASEWLFMGSAYVPPMAVEEGGSARQGRVTIQTNTPAAVDILVDCVALLPHDEQQVVASYGSLDTPAGLTLASLRKWVIGTDRHGRDYGLLLNTGDDSEEGQLSVLGPCLAGPGDTTFVVIPEVAGGVSNVADIDLDIVLRIIPRYRFLTGGV